MRNNNNKKTPKLSFPEIDMSNDILMFFCCFLFYFVVDDDIIVLYCSYQPLL